MTQLFCTYVPTKKGVFGFSAFFGMFQPSKHAHIGKVRHSHIKTILFERPCWFDLFSSKLTSSIFNFTYLCRFPNNFSKNFYHPVPDFMHIWARKGSYCMYKLLSRLRKVFFNNFSFFIVFNGKYWWNSANHTCF